MSELPGEHLAGFIEGGKRLPPDLAHKFVRHSLSDEKRITAPFNLRKFTMALLVETYNDRELTCEENTASAARPNIETYDGRTLTFYQNIQHTAKPNTAVTDIATNRFNIYQQLVKAGAIVFGETAAVSRSGKEIPEDVAVYIDTRLGKMPINNMLKWVSDNDPRLDYINASSGNEAGLVPLDEIKTLVTRGLHETGLAERIAQIRTEDAAKPLDLRDLIR